MTDKGQLRSQLFADFIGKRLDQKLRSVIEQFARDPQFEPIDSLMISPGAWNHAKAMGVRPQLVFAHPDILQAHPQASLYYRGMAFLSRKRVQQETATSVREWEEGTRKTPVRPETAQKVACFYNAIISSIIEGSTDWTLDNGYRSILATMGITLDGQFRNKIGDMADTLLKSRIVAWLKGRQLIPPEEPELGRYQLPQGTTMQYGSEPDIAFLRGGRLVATIEIKGGEDPAGALERLGAMAKSFEETPPGCVNFLVAAVITSEMRKRIDNMGNVKAFLLQGLSQDGERWDDFTNEVFHHALRVV